MAQNEILSLLNAATADERLEQLRLLTVAPIDKPFEDVNNHIHTTFSFSPYSPTAAVWFARQAGLSTCGIIDHDSIAGAKEFIEAGRILHMPTTIGIECRVNFYGTPFAGRRINNPDQSGVAYITLHGLPHDATDAVQAHFAPYRAARGKRNAHMVGAINVMLNPYDICINYERDVVPLSEHKNGGSVTERHIARALSEALMRKFACGSDLIGFLCDTLNLTMAEKQRVLLAEEKNPYRMYDLLGYIKSDLIGRFYIDATAEECPDVREILALSKRVGAIASYAYLGDVGASITGDKRTQTFEDAYLDELVTYIAQLGFEGISFMPSRNTPEQLARIMSLSSTHNLMQISGEDINQPRQAFVCVAQRAPEFSHLQDAAWALIGHELRCTPGAQYGLFSSDSVRTCPNLKRRIQAFAHYARGVYA